MPSKGNGSNPTKFGQTLFCVILVVTHTHCTLAALWQQQSDCSAKLVGHRGYSLEGAGPPSTSSLPEALPRGGAGGLIRQLSISGNHCAPLTWLKYSQFRIRSRMVTIQVAKSMRSLSAGSRSGTAAPLIWCICADRIAYGCNDRVHE